MILTIEIPDNAKDVKVKVLCDGKKCHCDSSRYRPGYWNGLNGGTDYGQYFDMNDTNRIREMAEIATALSEYGIDYNLTKLRKQYRITISKNDYIHMDDLLRQRIFDINCFHDKL